MALSRQKYYLELILVGLFIIVVLVLAAVSLRSIENRVRNGAGKALQAVLYTTNEALHVWVADHKKVVMEIASQPRLLELAKMQLSIPRDGESLLKSPTLGQIRSYLQPTLERRGYVGIFIIAPDKINVASMRDANVGTRNLITEQDGRSLDSVFEGNCRLIPPMWSDVPLRDTSGALMSEILTLFFAAPIIDDTGEVIAVFTVRMDPFKDFTRIAKLGRIGRTGETYAIDGKGMLLTESRFDDELRRVGLIKPGKGAIGSIKVSDPGVNLIEGAPSLVPLKDQPLTRLASRVVLGNSVTDVSGYRDYRGIPVLGAGLWTSQLGLGVISEIDEQEALEPYYATRNVVWVVLGTTVTLAAVLFLYMVFIRRRAEEELQNAYDLLEVRVKDRTSDLAALNEKLHREIVERVRAEEQLTRAKDDLSDANSKLQAFATTDFLTGISNRRSFDEGLHQEWRRCVRDQKPLSMLMLDLDHFKAYNDRYGHQAGDECLKRIASVLKDASVGRRPGDIIARYGGEEFVIVLPGTQQMDAFSLGERLCELVRAENILHEGTQVPQTNIVTVSVGLATEVPQKDSFPKALIQKADKALYTAKERGRNRVEVYELD